MSSEFDVRISQIGEAIQGLVNAVKQADEQVESLSGEFDKLITDARTITELADAMVELDRALESLGKSRGIDQLRAALAGIAEEVNSLNVGNISTVTDAIERQTRLVGQIADAQDRIHKAALDTQTAFQQVRSELVPLLAELATMDSRLDNIAGALGSISGAAANAGQLSTLIDSIRDASTSVRPEVWKQTGVGMEKLVNAINLLDLTKIAALRDLANAGAPISVHINDKAPYKPKPKEAAAATEVATTTSTAASPVAVDGGPDGRQGVPHKRIEIKVPEQYKPKELVRETVSLLRSSLQSDVGEGTSSSDLENYAVVERLFDKSLTATRRMLDNYQGQSMGTYGVAALRRSAFLTQNQTEAQKDRRNRVLSLMSEIAFDDYGKLRGVPDLVEVASKKPVLKDLRREDLYLLSMTVREVAEKTSKTLTDTRALQIQEAESLKARQDAAYAKLSAKESVPASTAEVKPAIPKSVPTTKEEFWSALTSESRITAIVSAIREEHESRNKATDSGIIKKAVESFLKTFMTRKFGEEGAEYAAEQLKSLVIQVAVSAPPLVAGQQSEPEVVITEKMEEYWSRITSEAMEKEAKKIARAQLKAQGKSASKANIEDIVHKMRLVDMQALYGDEGVRYYEEQRRNATTSTTDPKPDKPTGTAQAFSIADAKNAYTSIKSEFTSIMSLLASSSQSALQSLLPDISGRLANLRSQFDAAMVNIDLLPKELRELFDALNSKIEKARKLISIAGELTTQMDEKDVSLNKLRDLGRTYLAEMIIRNTLAGHKENGFEDVPSGEVHKTEGGVLYRKRASAESQSKHRDELIDAIHAQMDEQKTDLVYLMSAGDLSSSSMSAKVGNKDVRTDHSMLAYRNPETREIMILDSYPGEAMDVPGMTPNRMNASHTRAVSGDPESRLGKFTIVVSTPVPVESDTAARIAAETAIVQGPWAAYSLIDKIGDTCSSGIIRGFEKSGIVLSDVEKTALGLNIGTPGDIARSLDANGGAQLSPTTVEDDDALYARFSSYLDKIESGKADVLNKWAAMVVEGTEVPQEAVRDGLAEYLKRGRMSDRGLERFTLGRLRELQEPGKLNLAEDLNAYIKPEAAINNYLGVIKRRSAQSTEQGSAQPLTLSEIKNTYTSVKSELSSIMAALASSSKGVLQSILPSVNERLENLRSRFDLVIKNIDQVPVELRELFQELRDSLQSAIKAISTVRGVLGQFDLTEASAAQIRGFASTALGTIAYNNVKNRKWAHEQTTGLEGSEPGVTYSDDDGSFYRVSPIKGVGEELTKEDAITRGQEFLKVIEDQMTAAGTNLIYLAQSGDAHAASTETDIGDKSAKLDHALLAYKNPETGTLSVLDLVPGGQDNSLDVPLMPLKDEMIASKSGVHGSAAEVLGHSPSLVGIPVMVDPLTAARIAAETAVVQQPGSGYSLISEFGETCSSSILEGFNRAGLNLQNLVKSSLGFNIATPAQMMDFVRNLNIAGASGYTDDNLAKAESYFSEAVARLNAEFDTYKKQASDVMEAEGGVSITSEQLARFASTSTTGDTDLDAKMSELLGGVKTDQNQPILDTLMSYGRTLEAATSFLSQATTERELREREPGRGVVEPPRAKEHVRLIKTQSPLEEDVRYVLSAAQAKWAESMTQLSALSESTFKSTIASVNKITKEVIKSLSGLSAFFDQIPAELSKAVTDLRMSFQELQRKVAKAEAEFTSASQMGNEVASVVDSLKSYSSRLVQSIAGDAAGLSSSADGSLEEHAQTKQQSERSREESVFKWLKNAIFDETGSDGSAAALKTEKERVTERERVLGKLGSLSPELKQAVEDVYDLVTQAAKLRILKPVIDDVVSGISTVSDLSTEFGDASVRVADAIKSANVSDLIKGLEELDNVVTKIDRAAAGDDMLTQLYYAVADIPSQLRQLVWGEDSIRSPIGIVTELVGLDSEEGSQVVNKRFAELKESWPVIDQMTGTISTVGKLSAEFGAIGAAIASAVDSKDVTKLLDSLEQMDEFVLRAKNQLLDSPATGTKDLAKNKESLTVNVDINVKPEEAAGGTQEGDSGNLAAPLQASSGGEAAAMRVRNDAGIVDRVSAGYKVVSTVTTNVGSIINSIREFLSIFKDGIGPHIIVDATRSLVKFYSALQNIAYTAGIASRPANSNRATVIVDMVDAGKQVYERAKAGTLGKDTRQRVQAAPHLPQSLTEDERKLEAKHAIEKMMKSRNFRMPLTQKQKDAMENMIERMARGEEIFDQDFIKMWNERPKRETMEKMPEIMASVVEDFNLNVQKREGDKAHERWQRRQDEAEAAAEQKRKDRNEKRRAARATESGETPVDSTEMSDAELDAVEAKGAQTPSTTTPPKPLGKPSDRIQMTAKKRANLVRVAELLEQDPKITANKVASTLGISKSAASELLSYARDDKKAEKPAPLPAAPQPGEPGARPEVKNKTVDEKRQEVIDLLTTNPRASASTVQNKLHVGASEAQDLLDLARARIRALKTPEIQIPLGKTPDGAALDADELDEYINRINALAKDLSIQTLHDYEEAMRATADRYSGFELDKDSLAAQFEAIQKERDRLYDAGLLSKKETTSPTVSVPIQPVPAAKPEPVASEKTDVVKYAERVAALAKDPTIDTFEAFADAMRSSQSEFPKVKLTDDNLRTAFGVVEEEQAKRQQTVSTRAGSVDVDVRVRADVPTNTSISGSATTVSPSDTLLEDLHNYATSSEKGGRLGTITQKELISFLTAREGKPTKQRIAEVEELLRSQEYPLMAPKRERKPKPEADPNATSTVEIPPVDGSGSANALVLPEGQTLAQTLVSQFSQQGQKVSRLTTQLNEAFFEVAGIRDVAPDAFTIASKEDVLKALRAPEAGLDKVARESMESHLQRNRLGGVNLSNSVEVQRPDGTLERATRESLALVVQNGPDSGLSAAEVAMHEVTHALVAKVGQADELANRDLLQLSQLGSLTEQYTQPAQWSMLQNAIKDELPQYGAIASGLSDPKYRKYVFNEEEVLANVGSAELTANADGTSSPQQMLWNAIYGPELYEKAKAFLQSHLADVYGDASLKYTREAVPEYNAKLSALRGEPVTDGGIVGDIAQNIYKMLGDLSSYFEAFFNQIWLSIKDFANRVWSLFGLTPNISEEQLQAATAQPLRVGNQDLNNRDIIDLITKVAFEVSGKTEDPWGRFAVSAAQSGIAYGRGDTDAVSMIREIRKSLYETLHETAGFKNIGESRNFLELLSGGEGLLASQVTKAVLDRVPLARLKSLDDAIGLLDRPIPRALQPLVGGQSTLLTGAAYTAGRYGMPLVDDRDQRSQVRAEMNRELRSFGDAIDSDTLTFDKSYDAASGLTRIAASARTADGVMHQFSGTIDSFGRVVKDVQIDQNSMMGQIKENLWRLPMEVMQESVQALAFGFMNLVGQIIDMQDELAEVALIISGVDATPEQMTKDTAGFLFDSIRAANITGQPFQEGITANIQNLKQLGFVQDDKKRQEIAGQLSVLQLGAQTAFGLDEEQALSTIPAIYSQFQSNVDMTSPEVLAMSEEDRATYRAEQALRATEATMDKLVLAQRESGAAGEDLMQVYAALGTSARDAGLEDSDLLSLAATASIRVPGGADEVSNSVKMMMERAYGEGADNLSRLGIQTMGVKEDEFGTPIVTRRKFTDILADAYELTQSNPELSGEVSQAFGAQRGAAQAAALIAGVPEQQRIEEAVSADTGGGEFLDVVERKSQQLGGELNKLQSSFALVLNQLMFGSGAADDFGKAVEGLSEFFVFLANVMKDNPEKVEGIKNIAKVVGTLFVYSLTKAVQALGFVGKGVGLVTNYMSAFVKSMIMVDTTGRMALTPLQRGLKMVVTAIDEVRVKGKGAASPMVVPMNEASKAVDKVTNSVERLENSLREVVIAANQSGDALTKSTLAAGEAFARGASTPDNGLNSKANKSRGMMALAATGNFLGTMIAPVAFDTMTGGMNADNFASIGVGIAGGVAGFFAGGPGGAIVGYAMAKSAADYFDVVGMFGTSQREEDSFANAFRLAYENNTVDPDKRAADAAAAEAATTQFGTSSGLNQLSAGLQAIESSTVEGTPLDFSSIGGFFGSLNANMPHNRAASGVYDGEAVTSGSLRNYEKYVVDNEQAAWYDLPARSFITGYKSSPYKYEEIKKVYDLIKALPDEVETIVFNAEFGSIEELAALVQKMFDPETDLGKEVLEIVSQVESLRTGQDGVTDAVSDTLGEYRKLATTLEELDTKLQAIKEHSQYAFSTPVGLPEYGSLGTFTRGLDAQFMPQLDAFGSVDFSDPATAEEATQSYSNLQRMMSASQQSARDLPGTLGLVKGLSEELGQDVDMSALTKLFYEGGAETQSGFADRTQELVGIIGMVQEYEAMLERIAVIEASAEYKGGTTPEEQMLYEKNLETLLMQKDARAEMYLQYKQYLDQVKQEPGMLMQIANAESKKAAIARKMSPTIIKGTAAKFQMPSAVDVSDFSIEDIEEAIAGAREKQKTLIDMFPEAAAEFAKKQFLLESDGQFKGVTGVDASFMQDILKEKEKKIEAPEMVDFRDKSDEQIQAILARARGLQEQAIGYAPDLKEDIDESRLLILRKNNDLLMELGISQEYLRMAMEDNTESQLRGHYNLPAGYRPPTIWDYYNDGGTEAGSENFPGMDKLGLVPMDFARSLAEKIANQPDGLGTSPDLNSLEGLVDPNASKLGYPEPGTPDRVIFPPELTLPDGIDTSVLNVGGVSIADILQQHREGEWDRSPYEKPETSTPNETGDGSLRSHRLSEITGGVDTDAILDPIKRVIGIFAGGSKGTTTSVTSPQSGLQRLVGAVSPMAGAVPGLIQNPTPSSVVGLAVAGAVTAAPAVMSAVNTRNSADQNAMSLGLGLFTQAVNIVTASLRTFDFTNLVSSAINRGMIKIVVNTTSGSASATGGGSGGSRSGSGSGALVGASQSGGKSVI